MKHLKSILLTLLTVILTLPASAQDFEYEGIWYTVLDSEAKTCKTKDGSYDIATSIGVPGNKLQGVIIIPSTVTDGINEYSVIEIGSYAFSNCNGLTGIAIPKGIKLIGDHAFEFTDITEIELPENITSVSNYTFRGCGSLRSITIPESVVSIGEYAFNYCWQMKTVIIPESVVSIGAFAFGDCLGLQSIQLPGKLTKIEEGTFTHCEYLNTVKLPGSITSIDEDAFYNCRSLTSIEFPESLNSICSSAFSGCESLTSIEFPESEFSIGSGAFSRCTSLKSVIIPESLKSFSNGVFKDCPLIESIEYKAASPSVSSYDSFNKEVYISATLRMPNTTLATVKSLEPWQYFKRIITRDGSIGFESAGDDFEYEGIWYTVIDTKAKTCRTKAGDGGTYGWQMTPGNTVEGDMVIPSRVILNSDEYQVVEIGEYGFCSQGKLTSVTFPDSLISIGSFSFYQCNGLNSVTFPNSVEYLGNHAFRECENIDEVTFSESLIYIGAAAFRACAFRSLEFPESLSEIREDAFGYCYNLQSIKFPSSMENIGGSAFASCTALTSVVLPEEIASISSYVFDGCTGITQITLPKTPTVIDTGAFRGCSALTSIEIPASITEFGYWVFEGCSSLSDILYLSEIPVKSGVDMFDGLVYENAILNMPNAAINDVKAIQPWNLFRHIIAKDGSSGFVSVGDDFEYEGVWYSVIDAEVKTAKTKDNGNHAAGDIVIPETATNGNESYTVIAVGEESFRGSDGLLSISLPASIDSIGERAFADCRRLTSLVWNSHTKLSDRVVEEIGNPNLLLYVDSLRFAPDGMTANVVADGVCDNLVLTPGYSFTPVHEFTSLHSSMVKDFRQKTLIGNAAGWETIVLPFDAMEVYAENLKSYMTPFAALTDIYQQRPYWLYKADAAEGWTEAPAIEAGIPYIISMPNNTAYVSGYNVDGPVIFSNPEPHRISAAVTAPYAVRWTTGREFRSLWLPLTETEAMDAMGLNVGISNLRDEDGQTLAPGSAFHADVCPQPLEAYVTRLGAERAMRIVGHQSSVIPVLSENGIDIRVEDGVIYARSDSDRTIHIFNPEGISVRTVTLTSGKTAAIDGLTPGIYLSAGRKLIVR